MLIHFDTGEEAAPSTTSDSHTSYRPTHPITLLQGPFEESILESLYDSHNEILAPTDGSARRQQLLSSPEYRRTVGGKWEQRSDENFHPLWKIIAQLSFGVHLLASGMARSEPEAVQILHDHATEFEGFIERTEEDFKLAAHDLSVRFNALDAPLRNSAGRDDALQRQQLKEILSSKSGGDIKHIVQRSDMALRDSLNDVRKAKSGVEIVRNYFKMIQQNRNSWTPKFREVYNEMFLKSRFWLDTLLDLYAEGLQLQDFIAQFLKAIRTIEYRVGLSDGEELVNNSTSQALVPHHSNPRSNPQNDRPLPPPPPAEPNSMAGVLTLPTGHTRPAPPNGLAMVKSTGQTNYAVPKKKFSKLKMKFSSSSASKAPRSGAALVHPRTTELNQLKAVTKVKPFFWKVLPRSFLMSSEPFAKKRYRGPSFKVISVRTMGSSDDLTTNASPLAYAS